MSTNLSSTRNKVSILAIPFSVLLILIFAFTGKANAQQIYGTVEPVTAYQANLPLIQVNPRMMLVTILGVENGTSVTVKINDPATEQNPDCMQTQIASFVNVYFSFSPNSYPPQNCAALKAGAIVTAELNGTSITYTITPLEFTRRDLVNDVIAGITDPGKEILVNFWSNTSGTDINLATVSDADGNWEINFSQLSPPVDLIPDDSWVSFKVCDNAGNSTVREINLRIPQIKVFTRSGEVHAYNFLANELVTLSIDDPATPDQLDFKTTQYYPNDDGDGFEVVPVKFFVPLDLLKTGNKIQMSGSVYTTEFTIWDLSVTSVDAPNDIVYGKGYPGKCVNVYIYRANYIISSVYCVIPDNNGNWTADFKNPPWRRPYFDNGMFISAIQTVGNNAIHYMYYPVIINHPPVANAGGPYMPVEGSMVTLDASLSSDPDNDPLTYEWDLDNDGLYDDATGFKAEITFPDNGWNVASLRVTDTSGAQSTDLRLLIVENVAPSADIGQGISLNENGQYLGSGSFSDPGQDTWTATVDYGTGIVEPLILNPDKTFSLNHTYTDNGVYTVNVCVTDDEFGMGCDTTEVKVFNVAPTVDIGQNGSLEEGGQFVGSGSFTDPGADNWTASVNYGAGAKPLALNNKTFALSHIYADNGIFPVEVCVTDDDAGIGCDTVEVTVFNVAPMITSITGPVGPMQTGTTVSVNAVFTDPGTGDTHTATWEWGDGSSSGGLVSGYTVSGSHVYSAAGVYTLTLTVTDDDGGWDTETFQYIVIYDPTGGFVTGGGWIKPVDKKAAFEFDIRYLKSAQTPTGSFIFQVPDEKLTFSSTKFDWLVVKGAKAFFKGEGKLNGVGNFGFLVSVIDGSPDKFRIKIWDKGTGAVFYDNQLGAADDASPVTAIGGGSIVIHK